MKDRVKAVKYTRVEGGTKQTADFEYYEDQLKEIRTQDVHKREVFSKVLERKITTRVIKIGKVWVHSLFFENGNIYDMIQGGYRLRELEKEVTI